MPQIALFCVKQKSHASLPKNIALRQTMKVMSYQLIKL